MPGSAGATQSPHEISNPETVSSSLLDLLWQFGWGGAVSMGGSNELVECFCGGERKTPPRQCLG